MLCCVVLSCAVLWGTGEVKGRGFLPSLIDGLIGAGVLFRVLGVGCLGGIIVAGLCRKGPVLHCALEKLGIVVCVELGCFFGDYFDVRGGVRA